MLNSSLSTLCHLASCAVALSRYSLTLENEEIRRITTDNSKQIAVHIVAKVDPLLQNEPARFRHFFGFEETHTRCKGSSDTPDPQ